MGEVVSTMGQLASSLNHFRAEARCPALSYIHWLHTEVTNEVREVEYEDWDDRVMNSTVLKGQHFSIDSKRYNVDEKLQHQR